MKLAFLDQHSTGAPPRWALLPLVGILAVLPLIPPFNQPYIVTWLVYCVWLAAAAVAFDFSAGYINVANLGFAAFVGSGGYAAAIVSIRTGLSPWLAMFVGMAMGGLLGIGCGVVTLRFRGIYAALTSWFLSLAIMGLATNLTDLTGGSVGLSTPTLFFGISNLPYYYTALAMLAVTFVVLTTLARTRIGLASRAIGQNLEAARASGIRPARYRVTNYAISCAFAGWLGAFYAYYFGVLTPNVMSITITVQVLVAVMIGGLGSLWGPVVGGIVVAILSQSLQSTFQELPGMNNILFGLLLILITVVYPGGLAKAVHDLVAARRSRQADRATGAQEPEAELVAGGKAPSQ